MPCLFSNTAEDNELGAMISSLSDHIRLHLRGESLSYKQWTHMIFMNLYSLGHLSKGGIRGESPLFYLLYTQYFQCSLTG